MLALLTRTLVSLAFFSTFATSAGPLKRPEACARISDLDHSKHFSSFPYFEYGWRSLQFNIRGIRTSIEHRQIDQLKVHSDAICHVSVALRRFARRIPENRRRSYLEQLSRIETLAIELAALDSSDAGDVLDASKALDDYAKRVAAAAQWPYRYRRRLALPL